MTNKEKYEHDYILGRIESCKSICFATQSIGSHRVPVTPVTASKLYWQVCIPKLCYGLEVMTLSDKSKDSLEHFHTIMSKQIQGLPSQCANPGSTSTIGWKPLETYIDIMRLMFLWRLLLLPISCFYKTVILQRFETIVYSSRKHCGPVWHMIETCKKYGLLEIVIDSLQDS